MDAGQATRILEAILFVSGQPVPLKRLQELLPEVEPAVLRELLRQLTEAYAAERHGLRIQEVAGGYHFVTHEDLAPWVKKALERSRPDAVSAAAMETLAIIAYRQPMTKAEIEAIRGVDVGASLDTLVERQFVRTAGRKDSPGRPFLYATTSEFLRHFGLKSLEALPSLALPAVPEPTAAEPTTTLQAAPSDGP